MFFVCYVCQHYTNLIWVNIQKGCFFLNSNNFLVQILDNYNCSKFSKHYLVDIGNNEISFCSGTKYTSRNPLIWTGSSYSTAILMWTYY